MTSFRSKLRSGPVLIEVIPPSKGAKTDRVEQALAEIGTILDACDADAVNVPEIIGSGFQSMDSLDFGQLVQARHDVDVVVNKVVVHEPLAAFKTWMDRALRSDVASAIVVGGERGGIYYPGPSVAQANRTARDLAEAAGRRDFMIGNVTLPTRTSEAARMASKAAAGCDYFTSQIVYEFPSANAHLQAYDDVCSFAGVEPNPVLYAFSPVQEKQDVTFLRYLGVNIPPEVEKAILADPGAGGASVRIIEDVWGQLVRAARERNVRVPIGAVVETVAKRNAGAVAPLVDRLRRDLRPAVATTSPPRRAA